MMMIKDFEDDFEKGMSAKNLKEKYGLSNRNYRYLKDRLNLKRKAPIHNLKDENHFKYYYKCRTGGYSIVKMVDGKIVYFCHVEKEEDAQEIVKKFIECDWDKNEKYRILYEVLG